MEKCNSGETKFKSQFNNLGFSFLLTGVFFIVLNSQFYKDASQVIDEKQEQDKWLDEQLELAKSCDAQHIVMFQHIPWFFGNPDESNNYFNIELNLRKQMLSKIKNAGIKYVFAGHYHRNAGGFDQELEMIVTSAIGQQINNDKDSGMRIVCVGSEKISHEYYELDSVPTSVTL